MSLQPWSIRDEGGGWWGGGSFVPPPAGYNDSDSWYLELREAGEELFAMQEIKQMPLPNDGRMNVSREARTDNPQTQCLSSTHTYSTELDQWKHCVIWYFLFFVIKLNFLQVQPSEVAVQQMCRLLLSSLQEKSGQVRDECDRWGKKSHIHFTDALLPNSKLF